MILLAVLTVLVITDHTHIEVTLHLHQAPITQSKSLWKTTKKNLNQDSWFEHKASQTWSSSANSYTAMFRAVREDQQGHKGQNTSWL
jgi:hypothetical protein